MYAGCGEERGFAVDTNYVEREGEKMIKVPAYKLKESDTVVIDKNFLNATSDDFEEGEYTLYIPVATLKEWVEEIEEKNKR